MNIKVKDKNIELKQSFRAHIIFEQVSGKSFEGKGITDILLFFYSTIMASETDIDLTFEDFITLVDAEPKLVTEFVEWLTRNNKVNEGLSEKKTLTPKRESKSKKK